MTCWTDVLRIFCAFAVDPVTWVKPGTEEIRAKKSDPKVAFFLTCKRSIMNGDVVQDLPELIRKGSEHLEQELAGQ